MFTCNFFPSTLPAEISSQMKHSCGFVLCREASIQGPLYFSPYSFFFLLLYLHAPCCCHLFFECDFALCICTLLLFSLPTPLSLLSLSLSLPSLPLPLPLSLSPSPPRVSPCNVALAASQLLRLKACVSFFCRLNDGSAFDLLVSWRTVQLVGCLCEEPVSGVAPLHTSLQLQALGVE